MHPLLEAAADGDLPPWAEAGKARREHVARVAELLDGWARAEGIPREERRRWRAAGILHDVLREAAPTDLRRDLPPEWRDLPDSLLHGPAGAVRLRDAGVRDAEFLHAIAYHTVGHPRLGALGRALYCADFLEPGRKSQQEWRKGLRKRYPRERTGVLREIARERIEHLLSRERAIAPSTAAFWERLLAEGRERGAEG